MVALNKEALENNSTRILKSGCAVIIPKYLRK
jgi:hypothetical protein